MNHAMGKSSISDFTLFLIIKIVEEKEYYINKNV